jgi:3',5'-cyclic-AMP phosphodiesterase
MSGETYAAGPVRIDLAGVIVALLDTVLPGRDSGTIDDDQLAWLDDLAAAADRPVLVMGHHHPWNPDAGTRPDAYFGIHPDASERLMAVVARRPAIIGTFAGHTHRNRVRHFSATGSVPHVEVACVKDFPGTWAEYRVYEGGVLQVHHRISTPDALAWSERCRGLYTDFGVDYSTFALGGLADRCFGFGGTVP